MTRTAIVAISRKGAALSQSLAASLTGETTIFLDRRFTASQASAVAFDLPVRPVIQRVFSEYPRLVLCMPAGAAVRLLAPLVRDKKADPAVVCVDDAARFAISLLSGHVGGADRLAQEVADILGAMPFRGDGAGTAVTATTTTVIVGTARDLMITVTIVTAITIATTTLTTVATGANEGNVVTSLEPSVGSLTTPSMELGAHSGRGAAPVLPG